jgi:hypothetical protein
MAPDNEHIALRRRMEKRLGRTLSDAAWAFAAEQTYVEEALDPAYAAGEDELATFLEGLLRVTDAPFRAPTGRSARTKSPEAPTSPYLTARIEAVSRLAAEAAAGDEEILRFRQRFLERAIPMSADEAEAYLELPVARRGRNRGDSADIPLEVLDYQNVRISHTLHVWRDSPLDELRRLAASLAESYPWQPAQAAAFVLEGLIPRATPFMLRFRQPMHEGRPRRAKLVMEVDVWMPAERVLHAYRDLQRRVLPGHNRPISRRSIDLVTFVQRHRPATWPEILELWNNEHPTARYSDYRRIHHAYARASRSLLFPRYRTYLGSASS